MPNMQNIRQTMQQMPGNMQQGNMPPGAGMVNHNMNMGMAAMGNQVQNPTSQIGGNMAGQINQMQMGNMQNQQMNPMGNMVSMPINQQQMGQNQMNVKNKTFFVGNFTDSSSIRFSVSR